MLTFITENLATIIVSAVILAVVVSIVVKMVRDKSTGKSSCGSCPSSSICHKK